MKPSQIKNIYARLEISPNASLEEIKRAYRIKANRWHYDRNPENREEFIAVCEAYRTITKEIGARKQFVEDLIKLAFQINMMGG